jgi:protein TonB
MSKLSLYETSWINLVFEKQNKEYGAYQLRQESAKTPCLHFYGLLLFASLASIPKIMSLLNPEKKIYTLTPESIDQIIQVTKIFPNQVKKLNNPFYRKQSNKTCPHCKTTAHKSNNSKSCTSDPDIAKTVKTQLQ